MSGRRDAVVARKVCAVITARPSYSRIRSALESIVDHPGLELQLVVSGSALLERYGEVVEQVRRDGFKVDAEVFSVVEGENLVSSAKSTGLGLVELATTFSNLKPDVVVTVADRYETLATAVAGSYLNIPVAHLQGGEVTGSIDEKVRHAVTKLSNLHFVSTEKAAERVIRMGEDADTVFVTGCPSIDLAVNVRDTKGLDFDPFETYGGVGPEPELSNGYLVVLQHPVTTEYVEAGNQVTQTLQAVHELRIPTLWFWPNVDAGADGTSKGIRAFREIAIPPNIHFFKSMSPEHFLSLANNSRCVVGNSSVGIRECAYLGVPAVNIGTRQSGRERGQNVLDVEHRADAIAEAIRSHLDNGQFPSDPIYGDGKSGQRIADLLATAPLRTEKQLTY